MISMTHWITLLSDRAVSTANSHQGINLGCYELKCGEKVKY